MATIYKTEGIVLKCLKYSESSVIVDIYTREKGLKSFIVSGLNSKKDRSKASCFRHLNILNIVAYDKPDGSLARIKEQQLAYVYETLSYDVVKSSIALFAIEVCKKAIRESEANEPMYRFLHSFFVKLDQQSEEYGLVPIYFMLDFTKHIGIAPINDWSPSSPNLDLLQGKYSSDTNIHTLGPELSLYISKLLLRDVSGIPKLNQTTKGQILDELIKYYQIHIDQFKTLKSLDVLREIF